MLDLRGFGARNLVMADHVHPTAFGQVWIAERALEVLAADGMDVRVRPSTLIAPGGRTRVRALQGDWTYVYRRAQGVGSWLGCVPRVGRAELLEPLAARSGSWRTSAARRPASPGPSEAAASPPGLAR